MALMAKYADWSRVFEERVLTFCNLFRPKSLSIALGISIEKGMISSCFSFSHSLIQPYRVSVCVARALFAVLIERVAGLSVANLRNLSVKIVKL